jgi:hypothetical protein
MQHEQFLSLGILRASPLHQLLLLLNAIIEVSLPFQDEFLPTTHTVVRQVLFHIGEIKKISETDNIRMMWKTGLLSDMRFMDEFHRVSEKTLDRLQEASKYENEFFVYMEIISFFS